MHTKNGTWLLNPNVIQKNKLFGFKKRNIVEAVGFTGVTIGIIFIIPFTPIVTFMSSVVLGGISFYISLRGYEGHSITQLLFSELSYHRQRRKLHLRGPEYTRKEKTYIDEEYSNKSEFEKLFSKIKKHINKFIEENSEN